MFCHPQCINTPAKTNIQQFCANTGCRLEEQPVVKDKRDDGESRKFLLSARLDNDDDDVCVSIYIYIYIGVWVINNFLKARCNCMFKTSNVLNAIENYLHCSLFIHQWKSAHHNFIYDLTSLKWRNVMLQEQPRKFLMFIIFTQPLRSGRIWHNVNFLSGV